MEHESPTPIVTRLKQRPPVFWFVNPLCDSEIVHGKPNATRPASTRRVEADLSCLPLYLAHETDVCLVEELPRTEWLTALQALGFRTPSFRRLGQWEDLPDETEISGLEPWGWSPEPFERFRNWQNRLIEIEGANGSWCRQVLSHQTFNQTGLGPLFSKVWSVGFLRQWLDSHPETHSAFSGPDTVGEVFRNWGAARKRLERSLAEGVPFVAKAPWGTAGTQNRRVLLPVDLDSDLGAWIESTIESQGAIILEPWLDKIADLSMQIEVSERDTRIVGIRQFVNGSRSEYRGTHLDPKLQTLPIEGQRFLNSPAAPLDQWHCFAATLGNALREARYRGPAGLDGMIWRENGELRLKPLVELNPRWTMGRVALEIESHVVDGVPATWIFLRTRELKEHGLPSQLSSAADLLSRRHPPRIKWTGLEARVEKGIVFTTDPERAQEALTALIVGAEALATIKLG